MQTSPDGLAKLVAREGRKLRAYQDTKKIWTIGIGHTSAAGPPVVTPGLTITAEECDALFAHDIVKYEKTVNESLNRPVPQVCYDALVSICFNIGQPKFKTSTFLRLINAGAWNDAAEAILLWNKPPEIQGRRRSEYEQFRSGLADLETPVHTPTQRPLLSIGSRGPDVLLLQQRLHSLGFYDKLLDGKFGNGTYLAVRAYQAKNRLFVDGKVGENTWTKLFSENG